MLKLLYRDLEEDPGEEDSTYEAGERWQELFEESDWYIPYREKVITKISDTCDVRSGRKHHIMKHFKNSTLGKEVRKHLQLRSKGQVLHGVKRGRLSGKSLHRLYTTNAAQPAVFKKSIHGKVKLDSAVTLLVDCSGSMGMTDRYDKYAIAAASAASLAQVVSGLRVKHEVLGFTEHRGWSELFIFKEFAERNLTPEQLINRFSSALVTQDHNTDGEQLQIAAERLMEIDVQNRVLIVLSDGRPAGRFHGNGLWYAKRVAEDIEKHSPIHLAGIGICDSAVKRIYKNCQVIHNMQQLAPAVLEVLKTNLLTM
jgi:cobalamin biosynthesis protein CobT